MTETHFILIVYGITAALLGLTAWMLWR